jgi:hypothetical protein
MGGMEKSGREEDFSERFTRIPILLFAGRGRGWVRVKRGNEHMQCSDPLNRRADRSIRLSVVHPVHSSIP